jgi:hypothetical protein
MKPMNLGNGPVHHSAAEVRQMCLNELQEPPKEDKNDKVLDVINKVTMFKIVVDKVNKKATDSHKERATTAYSGFSWPNKKSLPKPKKRDLIFTMAPNPIGAANNDKNNNKFRKHFEGLENASFAI